MKLDRVRPEVDITARDPDDATSDARMLDSVLEYRPWVQAIRLEGVTERRTISPETGESEGGFDRWTHQPRGG